MDTRANDEMEGSIKVIRIFSGEKSPEQVVIELIKAHQDRQPEE